MRSKSGPGGTLYYYGLCELAQRQAVLVRKDNPSDRAIKSDRAKVVMTAGCISITFDIPNYVYNPREIGNSELCNIGAGTFGTHIFLQSLHALTQHLAIWQICNNGLNISFIPNPLQGPSVIHIIYPHQPH